MATKRLAQCNVIAAFPRLEDATAALDGLHDEGIPHGELSLLGPDREMRPGGSAPTEARAAGTSGLAKSALLGIGAGGATGGVLGSLVAVGVATIPGVGIAAGAAALYGAVSGAAAGHITGGLIGAEAGARKTMMWEQTMNPLLARVEEGSYLVGVHTEEEDRAERARELFEDMSSAEEVARLDADESFVPPGDFAAVAGRDVPSGEPDRPGAELGHDRAEYPDAKLVGMEERGDSPTSGRPDAAEREKRVPSPDGDEDDDEG